MLKEQLLNDFKNSTKEKNDLRKNVIQMARAAILQFEKDNAVQLEDDKIVEIIAKEVKKRKDAIPDYEKSGKIEMLENLKKEIEILTEYLPKQLSAEEVEEIVKGIIAETGAQDIKAMGNVMKLAKEKIGPASDGKTISDIVKKLLKEVMENVVKLEVPLLVEIEYGDDWYQAK